MIEVLSSCAVKGIIALWCMSDGSHITHDLIKGSMELQSLPVYICSSDDIGELVDAISFSMQSCPDRTLCSCEGVSG